MTRSDDTKSERLWEHFESLPKQEHAVRLGMWIFISSETLLFAGLFGLYVAYWVEYSAEFREAMQHNKLWLGTINTAILITSSFTSAWAVHALRHGRQKVATLSLLGTALLGVIFLGFKSYEYASHFQHGIFPGGYYHFEELATRGAKLFFTLYFFMTGLHFLHLVAAIGVVLWLVARVRRKRATPEYHVEVEGGVLYWHMVDGVWLFLWPLFYLIG